MKLSATHQTPNHLPRLHSNFSLIHSSVSLPSSVCTQVRLNLVHIFTTTNRDKERLGRIVRLQANKREEVKKVFAGEIAAAVGLKNAKTSHTFVMKIILLFSTHQIRKPVVSLRIEPKTKADQEKWVLL
jgi:translation elongation factor EF-G